MRKFITAIVLLAAPASWAAAAWQVQPNSWGGSNCHLTTDAIELSDGYGKTPVQLRLSDARLLVDTESNIDLGFKDVGLRVDHNTLIMADGTEKEQDVVFERQIGTIIEQFIVGHEASVQLRFWPTYPATKAYQGVFSLIGFTKAYRAYQSCR